MINDVIVERVISPVCNTPLRLCRPHTHAILRAPNPAPPPVEFDGGGGDEKWISLGCCEIIVASIESCSMLFVGRWK